MAICQKLIKTETSRIENTNDEKMKKSYKFSINILFVAIAFVAAGVLFHIYNNGNRSPEPKCNMFEIYEGRTTLMVDGASIQFDTESKSEILVAISSKTSKEIYDHRYYEERLEFARNGWSESMLSYSKISISYEEKNTIVSIRYDEYSVGELSRSSTIWLPYDTALKIFALG